MYVLGAFWDTVMELEIESMGFGNWMTLLVGIYRIMPDIDRFCE